MYKLIGIAFGALVVTSTCVSASESTRKPTESEILQRESQDPRSFLSVLPKDIITETQMKLKHCPVLTAQNEIFDKIMSSSLADLSDAEIKKFETSKRDQSIRENWKKGYVVQIEGRDYGYTDNLGYSVHLGTPGDSTPKTLKDLLVADNPAFSLNGVFSDVDGKPEANGQLCLYEGSKPGKYAYKFQIVFRGDDVSLNKYFGMVIKRATRLNK